MKSRFNSAGVSMKYYLAPMEEITGFVFRNLISEMFGEWDKVFTPFISPMEKKPLRTRESRDVAAENNVGRNLVPQILTNNADRFAETALYLSNLGYDEINLNLGCPSGTAVAKGKGSGLLRDLHTLEQFLTESFSRTHQRCPEIRISAKTRIGLESPDEFAEIYALLSQYPFSELIIHPRIQKEFYKSKPHMNAFEITLKTGRFSVCYNGDLFSADDVRRFHEQYPMVDRLMIGRGAVTDPGILREIRTGRKISAHERKDFADALFLRYAELYGNEKDAVFKLKNLWLYWGPLFPDRQKQVRNIMKTNKPTEYQQNVDSVFQSS